MVPGKKALFIINKHSGVGYETSMEGRIRSESSKHDIECSIEYTQSRGHAISLAHDASKNGFHYVVAVGGDGTINEVARGLLNSEITMGILPRGSGNGLARHLGISVNFDEAIGNLFKSEVIAMDTLTINDKLSLNVSGLGFDGHIANLFAGKSIRGLFGYLKVGLKEFFKFPEFEAELTLNEITFFYKTFVIAIANSSQYGNNVRIAPSASVRDGMFHITIIKKIPPYRLDFIYSLVNGSLKKSGLCDMFQGKELHIRTSKPVPYHIDGEPSGLADNFIINLNPASLRILIPNPYFGSDI